MNAEVHPDRILAELDRLWTSLAQQAGGTGSDAVMPQPRGPWDKLQLVSGGIRKGSGQAESLSHPAAQAVVPETENV